MRQESSITRLCDELDCYKAAVFNITKNFITRHVCLDHRQQKPEHRQSILFQEIGNEKKKGSSY